MKKINHLKDVFEIEFYDKKYICAITDMVAKNREGQFRLEFCGQGAIKGPFLKAKKSKIKRVKNDLERKI